MNESINEDWEFATNVVKKIYAKLRISYPKKGFVYDSNVKNYILSKMPQIPYLRRIKISDNENVDLRYLLYCLCHHKMPTITKLREISEFNASIIRGYCPICNHKVQEGNRVYCAQCQAARANISRLTYLLRLVDEVGKDLLVFLSKQFKDVIDCFIKNLKSYWERLKLQTVGRYTLKDVILLHICLKSIAYAKEGKKPINS
jgi:hypothetical protein